MLPNDVMDRVANARSKILRIVESIEAIPETKRPDNCAHTHWAEDYQWLHTRIYQSGGYKNLTLDVTLAAVSLILAERDLDDGCEARRKAETAA